MKNGGDLNPDSKQVKEYFAHGSGEVGGVLVGKRHSEGGIKAINKSTNQPIEMEGGEVVITRNAVSDNEKREFEGEMLTNKEILSKINQSGGGVAIFGDGGDVEAKGCSYCTGKKFKYGGKMVTDYDIYSDVNMPNDKQFRYSNLPSNAIDVADLDLSKLSDTEKYILNELKTANRVQVNRQTANNIPNIEGIGILYVTPNNEHGCMDIFITDYGKDVLRNHETIEFERGGISDCGCSQTGTFAKGGNVDGKYFKGVNHKYENQFQINKAIEELITEVPKNKLSPEEIGFISYYAGYGGLEKFGAKGKGLLYEYFTPSEIAKKMWGLAYKHGFEGGLVLEPSCGIGEFIKYAPKQELVTGFEINETSAKICSILYPKAKIETKYFETLFIKNNSSIKGNVKGLNKYSLVIGNPPYGSMGGLYAGMGEKDYTKANNYIDYFILRGLDLLESGGLLIYIIGTEVAAGGKPFLQQGMNAVKESIAEKADLVDAYRLPNGLFETTDVLTDIVIFKKK